MCFSATASFGAGAIAATAGVISVARTGTKGQIMMASIPIIFAVQQFVEGGVWLAMTHEEYAHLRVMFVAAFLVFAQVVWPLWVPLSVLNIEEQPVRRLALRALVLVSVIMAPLQAYRLLSHQFDAQITPHHVHYTVGQAGTFFTILLNICYFLTTIVPVFLSTHKRVLTLAMINLISLLVSVTFFKDNVISVWCFAAALISWQVIRVISALNKPTSLPVPQG